MPNEQSATTPNNAQGNNRAENSAANSTASQTSASNSVSPEGVVMDMELKHIHSSNVNLAGGHVINNNIQITSAKQAKKLIQELKETILREQVPQRPSADAPLQDQVDHWFQYGLETDREKLFAVLLSIFDGIRYPDFRDIYELIIDKLKIEAEDEKVRSPFVTADDKLIKKVEAQTQYDSQILEETITFKDKQYPDAIFTTLRKLHRGLLLDLLPSLKLIVERYRYWEVRYRAALAIAEIGKLGFQRVRTMVLEAWANDERDYVRASVGYPLALLALDNNSRKAVQEVMADWTDIHWHDSGEAWRYRWTAASVCKQLGSLDEAWAQQWAYTDLRTIAGFDDIRIADAVIHSLVVLSLQGQLEKVLLAIKEWIEQGNARSANDAAPEVRCIVGILAFLALSEIHVELATEERAEVEAIGVQVGNLFDLVCQSEAQNGNYWQIVVAVGIRAFEFRLTNDFFNLIEDWTRYAADNPAFQETVRHLVVAVFGKARPHQREHIFNRLSRWEQQRKDEKLAKMAASAKQMIKNGGIDAVDTPPSARPAASRRIVFGDWQ